MKQKQHLINYTILFVTLCIAPIGSFAQVDSMMQSVTLDGVEVKTARRTSKVMSGADGHATLDMTLLSKLPQILGSADPVHYSQMLPEIQTNGEYRGGINIQGCESSHNLVSIGSVPVYYPVHLLGFFSVFNSSHYDKCSISKFMDAKSANRLGGELSMSLPSARVDSLSGEFSVGMISSQGTLNLPVGKKTFCRASFRKTYINMLYGSWLSSDDGDVKYSFYDVNFTLSHQVNSYHRVTLDYYGGQDNGTFKDGSFVAGFRGKWGNQLLGLHHEYHGGHGLSMVSRLYVTSHRNTFSMRMQAMEYKLPSSILDVGVKHQARFKRIEWGADAVLHRVKPQTLQTSGTMMAGYSAGDVANTGEMSGYVAYEQPLAEHVSVEVGLRGSVYGARSTGFFANVDPSVQLKSKGETVDLFLGCAMKHQYLFQTGFSDAGLPTEFWLSSDEAYKPQYSQSVSGGASAYLLARRYKLTVNAFYKKLHDQVEYVGNILDFINSEYKIDNFLQRGSGQNYGASLMLHKCTGNLSGWISYTYTHARRTFHSPSLDGCYPANHERPHEINAVATCSLGKHWDVGATLVYASGTPFTAADYLSLINGNVIAHYREHNANRLQPYCRLDLSVSYKWKPRFAKENGINLSVYNATGRGNELFYYVSTHADGNFSYKPKSFVVSILPSVSYYCKF